jgi:hypothetical protein
MSGESWIGIRKGNKQDRGKRKVDRIGKWTKEGRETARKVGSRRKGNWI